METQTHYGLILKHLRIREGMSVQVFGETIGKSSGWVSQVENNRGDTRLTEIQFNKIVECLGAEGQRKMFRTWVANHKNADRVDRTMDGAVLKSLRKKMGLTLTEAATHIRVSASQLSKLERGLKAVSAALRKQIMSAYGYRPSSFKNLSSDPVRSKSVPLRFKLDILMQQLTPEEVESVYKFVQNLKKIKKDSKCNEFSL